jgi:hypothetical protein
MAKVRIRWNKGCFSELRTLPAVMAELNAHAERIAKTAGRGFEPRPAAKTGGRIRGRAAVLTATPRAMVVQAKRHVLEQAL